MTERNTYYAVLHLCTNQDCLGAVVAHYTPSDHNFPYRYLYHFHDPKWQAHKVPDLVPDRPRAMLQSANDASHVPIACAAAAIRAVEAMMAEVGYKKRALRSEEANRSGGAGPKITTAHG